MLVALDLDGARAVKANPAVDSWIVRCDATREETLRERLRLRLKEHESTVAKRLEFARAEWETAQPGGPPPRCSWTTRTTSTTSSRCSARA